MLTDTICAESSIVYYEYDEIEAFTASRRQEVRTAERVASYGRINPFQSPSRFVSVSPAHAGETDTSGDPLGLSNCHISSTSSPVFLETPDSWAQELDEKNLREHARWVAKEEKRLREKDEDGYQKEVGEWQKKRKVTFHPEGSLIEIQAVQGYELYENPNRSPRGKVEGFSSKARLRLLRLVSSLKRYVLPLFVTLTYPGVWDADPETWKRDLDRLGVWLSREYPGASFVWKLEPQERGAPHFHLLLYGVAFLPWVRLGKVWAEIVSGLEFSEGCPEGSESSWFDDATRRESWLKTATGRRAKSRDDWEEIPAGVVDHIRAGVQVQRAESYRGVLSYVSKNYMGKECAFPPGTGFVGRFWGVIGRKHLPHSAVVVEEISVAAFHRLRRIFRKVARSRGIDRSGGGKMTIYTQGHLQWSRALDFCEGEAIERLTLFKHITDKDIVKQMQLLKASQPF